MTTPALGPAAAAHDCWLAGCTRDVIAQWRRRLTAEELAAVIDAEQARRDEVLAHADPDLPAPAFGPLPCAEDCTRAVHACGTHAITLDAAAHVHQATCSSPDPQLLPACGCTPETPQPDAEPGQDVITLPTGWTVPTSP